MIKTTQQLTALGRADISYNTITFHIEASGGAEEVASLRRIVADIKLNGGTVSSMGGGRDRLEYSCSVCICEDGDYYSTVGGLIIINEELARKTIATVVGGVY